jgi:hypothetical protein
MLMTRIVYLSFTLVVHTLNFAALWAARNNPHEIDAIVPAVLLINALAWPLALVIAYRIGQVTGVEYFRQVRAKIAAIRASRHAASPKR